MIVLSVGMPRAGSGWHYNLIHDLMEADGYTDARVIREQYHLHSILTEVNCNIGVLSLRRMGMVALPALMGEDFVIKAHAGPSVSSRFLQRLGLLRITYIYRDPRDAMLSAYDYGQRALQRGRPNAFSHLTDFEKSLDFMMDYIHIWERWMREKDVLIARYEDLLTDYDNETNRLVEFLTLDGSRPQARAEPSRSIQKVIEHYRPGASDEQQGLHFFKGRIGRFRESYTAEQQAAMKDRLGGYLSKMDYQI
jgi:hypothetical protein